MIDVRMRDDVPASVKEHDHLVPGVFPGDLQRVLHGVSVTLLKVDVEQQLDPEVLQQHDLSHAQGSVAFVLKRGKLEQDGVLFAFEQVPEQVEVDSLRFLYHFLGCCEVRGQTVRIKWRRHQTLPRQELSNLRQRLPVRLKRYGVFNQRLSVCPVLVAKAEIQGVISVRLSLVFGVRIQDLGDELCLTSHQRGLELISFSPVDRAT